MALWEYKTITSGIHGFATPALLEAYLNNLGKDEWEIVSYQPSPANPLAFTGLVRRPTQRDWTPPPALVPAPPPQQPPASDRKPQNGGSAAPHPEPAKSETSAEPAGETAAAADPDNPQSAIQNPQPGDALRHVRNTEHDLDPEAPADDTDDTDDEWDSLDLDDDLPTFFDAIKPHMRGNQKGPGQSVAVDYLMKRWELRETEILGALKECGIAIPQTEDAEPEYFEFEDDLFWVNRNNRGQFFINAREKPRPIFRTVPATPLSPDDPAYAELAAERAEEKARIEKRNTERAARAGEAARRRAETADPDANTPAGAEPPEAAAGPPPAPSSNAPILERIRPMMRRNRHGPGHSGSVGFLARALKIADADLIAQLAALGLHIPAANEKPTFVEIGATLYWLNKDNRGNIWINARENKNGAKKLPAAEPPPAEQSAAPATQQQLELPATPEAAPEPIAPAEQPPPPAQPVATPDTPADAAPPSDAPAAGAEAPHSSFSILHSTLGGEAAALAAVRPLLKPNKSGSGVSGETGYLARALDQNETEFVAALTGAGLVVPPDAGAKPTFVEHEGEIFWFSFYEKDGSTSIWLNAKPAKAKKKTTRTRGKAKAPKSAGQA